MCQPLSQACRRIVPFQVERGRDGIMECRFGVAVIAGCAGKRNNVIHVTVGALSELFEECQPPPQVIVPPGEIVFGGASLHAAIGEIELNAGSRGLTAFVTNNAARSWSGKSH